MKNILRFSSFATILALNIISCKSTTGPVIPASNSGDQLFFDVTTGPDSTQFGVHVINIDGTGEKLLYLRGRITSAPRAGKLVFMRFSSGKNEDTTTFYLGDVSGSTEQKLFSMEERADFAILSPDGQKIIYDDSANQINTFDISTHSQLGLAQHMELGSILPIISDDSKTIYAVFNSPQGLFSMDINETNPKLVTSDGIEYLTASEEHQMFDLSPDGSKLCYFLNMKGIQLQVNDILPSTSVIDTSNYGLTDAVTWSPKGDKIAFAFSNEASYSNEGIAIYDISLKKTSIFSGLQLGNSQAVENIEWSKDGNSLFIVIFDHNSYSSKIVLMDANTGSNSTLKTGGAKLGYAFRSRNIGEH